MAITANDLNIRATFNLDGTPSIMVTDLFDYVSASIALANVAGILTIVSPAGTTIYTNASYASPDIDHDVSTSSTTYSLPLDGNSDVLEGDYIITYSVQDSTGTPYVVSNAFTMTYTFETPTVSIETDYDCLDVFLKSEDTTNYSYVYQGTTISPTITRNHKLSFPLGSGLTQIDSTSAIIQVEEFSTGVHQIFIESTLSYALTSSLTVVVTVMGSKDDLDVICETAVRTYYCGLKELNEKYNRFKATNPAKAKEKLEYFQYGVSLITMIRQAYACNKRADVTTYAEQLAAFIDCDCGCADGSTPVIISNVTSILNAFSTWYSGEAAPASTLGQNGDFYVATSTQTFYKRVAGAWVEIFAVTDGEDGNTILSGVIAPTGDDGVDGDFFINTATSTIYGPKASGTWPSGVSLVGPAGANGANGANGAPGLSLINFSTLSVDSTTSGTLVNVASLPGGVGTMNVTLSEVGDGVIVLFSLYGDSTTASGRGAILINGAVVELANFLTSGVALLESEIVLSSETTLDVLTKIYVGAGATGTVNDRASGDLEVYTGFNRVTVGSPIFALGFQFQSDGTNEVFSEYISVKQFKGSI